MNRSALKSYAPQARRDFIQAVTDRAAFFGLRDKKVEPLQETGDVVIICGKAFPRVVAGQRRLLEERINRQGFDQVMEAMAYTWFNRFVALRYMELHGYLDHGYRVLSHPEGKATPEIVEQAEHVTLSGLDNQKVIELKLDGTKESELYRLLLVAQCNALHEAMPFLFERIDDETELLLPDNLLHSDSLIRKLVNEIQEGDWKEVEIIGWIYQFYISEKKDQVIGKVVKSENIPAATQLFTPNWIVKYLVQNTLGRQWLATYPDSSLRQQMEYYIEPAEQTEEVKAQLKAITPESLDPEKLTLLDPACGSGHILVEAYDLFKAIYQERGYRSRDIPRLILEKNLFGLEIDDRAAQLAAFALLMKARADDRTIFADFIQPNVLAIQESKGLEKLLRPDAADVTPTGEPLVADQDLFPDTKKQLTLKKQPQENPVVAVEPCLRELIKLFEHGKTFGSLIRVPPTLAAQLPAARLSIEAMMRKGQLWDHRIAIGMRPLVEQAELLARTYDALVTNPPYMGGNGMNAALKDYAKATFPDSKSDLFAMFMEQNFHLAKSTGFVGMITMQSWMFLSSYEELRVNLIEKQSLVCMAHLGARGFDAIGGEVVQTTTYVSLNHPIHELKAVFHRLIDGNSEAEKAQACKEAIRNKKCGWSYEAKPDDFKKIPGSPVAYWASKQAISLYERATLLDAIAPALSGMSSCNSDRFLRLWHEVDSQHISWKSRDHAETIACGAKWFPYNKGGGSRRWFGYNETVINWENNGKNIKTFVVSNPNDPETTHWSRRLFNLDAFFKPGITWSAISSSYFAGRIVEAGIIPGTGSKTIVSFSDFRDVLLILGFLNSKVATYFFSFITPTLNFEAGDVGKLPIPNFTAAGRETVTGFVDRLVKLSKEDWVSVETSAGFLECSLLANSVKRTSVEESFEAWQNFCGERLRLMVNLESQVHRFFIEACKLQDELSDHVVEQQVALARADREQDMKRLISYAIGCMMGRYSLDKPGLIYAHTGSVGFDAAQYKTFPADTDGIIPLTEVGWFSNDATERVVEFISKAWRREHLEENLRFIADSVGSNKGEQPLESIRRYLSQSFFKDHLQSYKRRPIYWLFSSGKQRAFQCLVYLHRYHEGTLARMRTEYVIPLQGKITARIEQLASDIQKATSTSHHKKLEKEQDALKKQQVELQAFDEKLRHFADKRISLDLDDGVKLNYGKFGDLLAEVKAVCGKSEDEE